jgi:thiamine kinase-like enzyme
MPNKNDAPNDHIQRIDSAIQESFGNTEWCLIMLLHGGLSGANTYLIEVKDKRYAIKLERMSDQEINFQRYFTVIDIASQEDLSPHLHYSNADNGVILMQYIDSKPHPQVTPDSIQKMAALLKKLHDGKQFPCWKSIFEIRDHFFQKLTIEYQQSQYIQQCMQESMRLQSYLSDPLDTKPSHCDLNPTNILFDGQQLYLVDWQAASPQNFYFDLACTANFFYFYSEELCQLFLNKYFGRLPTIEENEKYTLMRRFTHIYYGIIFISLPLCAQIMLSPLTDSEISALPSYLDFMKSIGSGETKLTDPATQQRFGYIFLKTAMSN